ncbi:unnamed protein product [Parascedosporium putredinis]|uniref:ATP-dependent DNA ligase family profile domain-containing protein n=1 Tax=Parascedosporium putredinis TaxID=1442378 RepID=A0A9P1MAK3_9PEZI|nr:unnamed protein product [Parascedosporium putredinis]CAI7992939.1 unnamed protein product [Parascedosporium putredinis]
MAQLPFSDVCKLLDVHHRHLLDPLDAPAGAALLSTLLPAKRTDRVYHLQDSRLEKIFERAQRLGDSRLRDLRRYKVPGSGLDLADCIYAILSATPNPNQALASVLEVDNLLRAAAARSEAVHAAVSLEAKWLTRLVLKDFRVIDVDESVIYRAYHGLLPRILRVRDNIPAAANVLRDILREERRTGLGAVGRPFWRKARSIKHCLDMGHGFMSVEKKIDGEYCQIHIDLSKGRDCIQIFSKSGKDSTKDRIRVHEQKCKILPFHKVRNHVTRSGRYLGSEMDSPPRSTEHLMVIYYDAFLIDDESLLGVRHSRRMEMLKDILSLRSGYAELVERRVLNFNKPQAASDLRSMFANCITSCEEGLVIKADEPMMVFNELREDFTGCPIKFKKEYIGTFGDLGDLAAVAARYDSRRAKVLRIPNLKWTHFYLGCLTNKSSLHLPGTVPEFTVVVVVEPDAAFLSTVVAHCQPGAPTFVLTRPPIFDVRCFAFEKPGNVGFYTPRFTTASKVHFDRAIGDVMTFDELQRVGQRAMAERPWEDGESQEFLKWVGKLEKADPKGFAVDRVTQSTVSSGPSPSPQPQFQPRLLGDHGMLPPGRRSMSLGAESIVGGTERYGDGSPKSAQKASHQSPNPTSPSRALTHQKKKQKKNTRDGGSGTIKPTASSQDTQSQQTRSHRDSRQRGRRRSSSRHSTAAAATSNMQAPRRALLVRRANGPPRPRLWRRKVITDKLLRRHGIEGYITDYEAWMPAAPERRPAGRKICLVEAGRREETRAFLDDLEGRPLTLADGGREYVEVYDWRVLEDVATLEEEQGQRARLANGAGAGAVRQDPWKKWWVGLV